MGGAVSTGQDNDDLIDNLVVADYIRTPLIEKVFRAVDRAEYFSPDSRTNAYKDLAWKSENLHISAPCIYSEVMEGLCLSPGLSFLNLGSGTGYLSTMVGLILGTNGVNHGVEIHQDVIQYALKRLENFKKFAGAIDEFNFCEPKFLHGNCLSLGSEMRQYDRVYCGAACPEPHENYMKNLLKIGGILVMPINDQLLQATRRSETVWDLKSLLPVSFANLVQPIHGKEELLNIVDVELPTLQSLCRSTVRNILRKNIDFEFPNLTYAPKTKKIPKKKRAMRRLVVPLFDTSDETSDEDRRGFVARRRTEALTRRHEREKNEAARKDMGNLIDLVLEQIRETRQNSEIQRRQREQELDNLTDCVQIGSVKLEDPRTWNVKAAEETDEEERALELEESSMSQIYYGDKADEYKIKISQCIAENNSILQNRPGVSSTLMETRAIIEHVGESETTNENAFSIGNNSTNHMEVSDQVELRGNEETGNVSGTESLDETINENGNGAVSKSKNKREKFDSGLGDEIIEKYTIGSDNSDLENVMEVDTSPSSDENLEERPNKRISHLRQGTGRKWRRLARSNGLSASSSENETTEDGTKIKHYSEIRTVPSPYTPLMKSKIQKLPLPPVLKNYLNFYREF